MLKLNKAVEKNQPLKTNIKDPCDQGLQRASERVI